MEFLKEIIRVVTSKSDPRKTLPELYDATDDQLSSRFIRGLESNLFHSDDEAAEVLYGTNKSDQRFRTLKSRASDRLLHSLLFLQIKQPEHSEYLSYYYKCTRNLICSQTLLRFASRKAATHLAERTIAIATRYQFTDICLALTALLRETAGIMGERRRFMAHNEELRRYLRILEAEYRSGELLDIIIMTAEQTRLKRSKLIELASEAITEMHALVKVHGTHTLILGYHRIALLKAELESKYEESIQQCDEALKYLLSHPHLSQKARVGEFTIKRMLSSLYIRQYRESLVMAEQCIYCFIEAGHNWYVALDVSCASALLCGEYVLAERYSSIATSHKRFPQQNEITKERWFLYNAYLNLAEMLELKEKSDEKRKIAFRLSTFLNSVPEFAKEKKIYNVHILILHAAFLIAEGNYDLAEKRIEYLRVYTTRYLKEKDFNRTRAFLRLLSSFPRLGFNAQLMRRDNTKALAELHATANDPMPAETNEFIPYDVIYEALLNVVAKIDVE